MRRAPSAGAGPPGAPATVPRWLLPATGLWAVLAAVALANATPIPVHGAAVLAVLGAVAAVHGGIHRRWRLAGPLAAAALLTAAAAALGLLPDGVDLGYGAGPAGSLAPRLIWPAALAVTSLEILWALNLHGRARRSGADSAAAAAKALAERQAQTQRRLGEDLAQLDARITAVETRLTTVP